MSSRPSASEAIRPPSRLALPSVLLTVLIWGSYFPIIEHLLLGWDVVTLSWARNVLAALALGLLLALTEGPGALVRGVPWRPVWLIGIVGVAANIVLSSYGVQFSGAVPAALIAGTTPVLAALMARVMFGQRPSADTWIAIVLAVVGVAVVVIGGNAWDGTFKGGEFMVLTAYVTWVWYMIVTQRWMPGFSQLRATTVTMVTGALSLSAAYGAMLIVGYGPVAFDASAGSLGLVFFSAVVSVAVGTVAWNFAVSRLGVTVTSMFGNLVPVVAVIIAVLWGGTISWLQALGGALVLVGVLYIQLRPARAAPRTSGVAEEEGQ